MPDSKRDAVLCLVTVFMLSFLATEPLLADKLTNDIAAHKIIVFGASGRVGSRVVNEALERGHDVTAVTRNPSAQGQQDGQTKVLAGDLLDAARAAELLVETLRAMGAAAQLASGNHGAHFNFGISTDNRRRGLGLYQPGERF